MNNHVLRGKRDMLQSVDYLVYCHIAYIYFLDASFLLLFFRLILQTHLLSAHDGSISSPIPFLSTLLVFFLSTCLHAGSILGRSGIIIDFIGSQHPPDVFRLCTLDVFIVFCQLTRLYIAQQQTMDVLEDSTTRRASSSHSLFAPIAVNSNYVHQSTASVTTLSPSTTEASQRFMTSDLEQDDSVPSSHTSDVYHHNDIITGVSFFQLLQPYTSRRRQ